MILFIAFLAVKKIINRNGRKESAKEFMGIALFKRVIVFILCVTCGFKKEEPQRAQRIRKEVYGIFRLFLICQYSDRIQIGGHL
jgi:hypothetical protein